VTPSVWRGAQCLITALVLVGCAHRPTLPSLPPLPPTLVDCETRWQAAADEARAAQVADAARREVQGFAHYRTNRMLASWQGETLSPAQWDDLTARLRDEALRAQATAAARLQQAPDPKLAPCADQLRLADLRDPRRLAQLQPRLQVAADYSRAQRLLGAYWLARPFLKAGISDFHAQMRERFRDTPLHGAAVRHLTPPAPVAPAPSLTGIARSPLGFPELGDAQWQALAVRHAPHWRVETRSADDQPGTPFRRADGTLEFHPETVVYWHRGWVRHGDQVLITLEYTLWFAARSRDGWADPYAGALDGLVWRVVLDPAGRPMLFDTQHPCGCYRYLYPRPDWALRDVDRRRDEVFLTPPWTPDGPPLQLSVAAGDHQLLHVGPVERQAAPGAIGYTLRPYRHLERGTLFGPEGIIAGSERGERWWLWPSGVPNPGAMRQRGRQPNAFIGTRHFDDPFWIDALLVPAGPPQP